MSEEKKIIDKIKIRLEKTPKSCLNEKYAEDIKFLLSLVEEQEQVIDEMEKYIIQQDTYIDNQGFYGDFANATTEYVKNSFLNKVKSEVK